MGWRLAHSLYALSTYLPLWWKVLAGQDECGPHLVGQLRLRAHWQRPGPLAPLLSSLQSSTSGKIQGLQLNARVCTQCLPAEVLVTCLVKIPGLCILAAFSSCLRGKEYGGAAAWCKLPKLWATAPLATDDKVGRAAWLLAWRNFTLKSIKIAVEKEIISSINYLLQLMWQVSYSQASQEALQGDYCSPTSQMRKLKTRKVEEHVQGPTARKWQNQVLNSYLSISRVLILDTLQLCLPKRGKTIYEGLDYSILIMRILKIANI